nr:copia protein [Tanacetum cinerariifolium]
MSSLFADTHNMVAILEKLDAAEGFKQIINFLSRCYIHYALTVNPHIYISCIKQFWNTASLKRSDDVTRLQALVDKKKIVISEDVIREILQLDDAEGMVCLPNKEIFADLAQMGYEKPSTKLTFYKAFFSNSSLKFYMYPQFIQLIIQNQIGDLSTHTTRYISLALTQKVFANLRRIGKGFSGVETPLFAVQETVVEDVANEAIPSTPLILPSPPSHEQSSPPQQPQIGTSQRIESSDDMEDDFHQERMIDNLDKDEGIELVVNQVRDADTAKTEGRHAAEQAQKQAEIYHLDLDHPFKILSIQEDDLEVQEVVEVVTTVKLITDVVAAATSQVSVSSATIFAAKPSIPAAAPIVVAAYTRRRKGYIKRYHGMKKRPQTESEARKNMMTYLKNTDGYKLDFFKGMSYDEIRPIFQARFDENMRFLLKSREEIEEEDREILKSINETPTQKEAKRRKLNKEAQEVEDLKKHLEVVNDEDDDVFTEATPLGRKVPVVDYQIVVINNKPRFKIIKADETHQNKARLVTQGHTQEEGIDYEEVFSPVARIEAIRLFLAYASFMGFLVYQMDVKSAFLYVTIEKEVYVCQPPGFEDPKNPDKVYEVVKALYGLHQAPRAWSLGKSASTPSDAEKPLLKDSDGEDVDVHTY